ncbi:bsl1845 [Bradyrhizobium diazoefficiens USDA 110]|uniref:Bsl1845 protein n=3 Tax=Bradyrhizobium TaxID=374 RepID=Q89TN9_BRADU|nr:hypothetical protein RN69_38760 [Bradyrhizobium japonicum]AND87442.1 hypothetical protein AAV28_06155 [Bradyrhizobium diazoefficiens USDA 110]APO50461.1 hypothetical protein BD122_09445 [Bradyrhizobium diazoefficiens]AWL91564.1 hypothetical protein CIT37_04340 [Bradyrhizobium ottawaense]BAL13226.1 hypothetical protein BJ6T_79800 [Bradyrhizobium japonicum USDA 6]
MPTKGRVPEPCTRSDDMEPASPPQTRHDSNAARNLSFIGSTSSVGTENASEATEHWNG